MTIEQVILVSLQSAGLFVIVWLAFRLIPAIPANTRAWTWRLVLLKPLIGLLPLAVVPIHVLPPDPAPAFVESLPAAELAGKGAGPVVIPPNSADDRPNPLLIAWLLGAAAVAGRGILETRKAHGIARRAEPVSNRVLLDHLDDLAGRAAMGMRPVRLLVSSEAGSAMLVGGRRPAIVFPREVLNASSEDDARLMIAHELAHHFRRDLAWLGVAWAIQSLFFFNPFVWLAVWASREAHESATDGFAIELAKTSSTRYAEMLVRTLVSARPALAPGAVFMSGSYRSIHRRLEAMKHFRSVSNPWRKALYGAFALSILCLMPAFRLAQASPIQARPESKYWIAEPSSRYSDNVSLEFMHYDVRQAIAKLLQRYGKSYSIAPQVQGDVTLALRNVTLGTALMNISRQVNARCRVQGRVYVIDVPGGESTFAIVPRGNARPPKQVRITMSYAKADAREVLRQLFRATPQTSFAIEPTVQGTVTVSLRNASLEEALKKVLGQIGATYRVEGGVYVVSRAKKHA